MAIDVDFTKGEVNSFLASGVPTYSSDTGVAFTVANPGDAPQLISSFYIMFGRVEVTMRAAPGRGIVSSMVLQSDDLDEIDLEWLGVDSGRVQTNYFGKGQTGNHDRGQFNPAPDNQGRWCTYVIDWTHERIVWTVDGTEIRIQTADTAGGQYPQTPMQVKFGAWAGGGPGNQQGTIDWAGGATNFGEGPWSMYVKNLRVTDYSTGKAYRYKDNSGSWQSIDAIEGEVNGNVGKAGTLTITASKSTPTGEGGAPEVPQGGIGRASGDATLTQTGWPWVPGAAPTGTVPDGWVMNEEGKIVPRSGAASTARPSRLVLLCGQVLLGALLLVRVI
jgi:hypothetical protein